jgi:hypothetical protein
MLSSATSHLDRHRRLVWPRRVPVPLPQPYLDFLDLPVPEACVWGQLTDQEKTIVIAAVARLMAKAAAVCNDQEQTNA